MYRLAFNTSTGNWEVQFLKFGFIWVSVKDPDSSPLQFNNLKAAN